MGPQSSGCVRSAFLLAEPDGSGEKLPRCRNKQHKFSGPNLGDWLQLERTQFQPRGNFSRGALAWGRIDHSLE
eukprot:1271351-Alexandrium_andersonii.AAC.1